MTENESTMGGATLGSNSIDADAIKENLKRAHAAEDRYVRQNALEMAIKISSGRGEYGDVLKAARAFEAYVRGETTAA